jgi:hypothetical protein
MTTSNIITTSSTSVIVPEVIRPVSPVQRDYAHSDVSTRYHHISTQEVIDSLRDANWEVAKTVIARCCRPDKQGFQKHFVTMRHSKENMEVGDCEMRIMLVNSHDGTSSMALFASLYRLICSNGMTIDQGQFSAIRIRHSSEDIRDQAIGGAQKIALLAPAIDANIKRMQSIQLTPDQQQVFAQQTLKLVWPDQSETYMNPNELLGARRDADKDSNLWSVYNRVQENVTRGGLYTEAGRRTRPIRSANRDLEFNRDLFDIAVSFAK